MLTRTHIALLAATLFVGGLFFISNTSNISTLTAQSASTHAGEGWQETPYLWAGKTLEELRPSVAKNIMPKYGELRFVYPSADACLTPASSDSSEILGRDLIWYQLETKEAVDVCLFRVFAALGDQAQIEAWLESQGFGSKLTTDSTSLGFVYGVEGERITSLSMTWRTSENGALYGVTEAQRRKQVSRVLHQTAGVQITEYGRVLGARLFEQSTWLM